MRKLLVLIIALGIPLAAAAVATGASSDHIKGFASPFLYGD